MHLAPALLFTLVSLAHCFPGGSIPSLPAQIDATTIINNNNVDKDGSTLASAAELHEMSLAASYARAAYSIKQLKDWSCEECQQPGIKATHLFRSLEFKSGFACYIAVNPAIKAIVYAFRGTDNLANVLTDLKYPKTPLFGPQGWGAELENAKEPQASLMKDANVHTGFLELYNDARDAKVFVSNHLARDDLKGYSVWITGHSLGAALATLAGVDLAKRHPEAKIRVFGYESPRVGDMGFARYFRSFPNLSAMRYVFAEDAVPHLPPASFGYVHIGREYWAPDHISSVTSHIIKCDYRDDLQEDPKCSASVKPDTNLSKARADHSNYFRVAY